MASHAKAKHKPQGGSKPASRRQVKVTAKQAKAMKLREAGAKFDVIAQELGYKSPASAYKAVLAGLRKTLTEPAEELRSLEVRRYDTLILAYWQRATNGDVDAFDRVIKAMAGRARILGLNAPERFEHTIKEIEAVQDRYARRKQTQGDQG